MPKRVARRGFGHARPPHRLVDRPLDHRFVQVVTMPDASPAVKVVERSRKHPLPGPLALRVRQGIREGCPAQAEGEIGFVLLVRFQLFGAVLLEPLGEPLP